MLNSEKKKLDVKDEDMTRKKKKTAKKHKTQRGAKKIRLKFPKRKTPKRKKR